jgi:hypothetical protein
VEIDNSIIDVTNQAEIINTNNNLKKYNVEVPYWANKSISSFYDIDRASFVIKNASFEQVFFYNIFKTKFLNGECFDLEGNRNYAFILIFDLLNEFNNHKDISKLENQIVFLGQCYPITKSYGIKWLIEKTEIYGSSDDVSRLKEENNYSHQSYQSNYEHNYWSLGSKYRIKLNLNDEEINLLNKLSNSAIYTSFCNIEFCFLEVLKLYLALISELKAKCEADKTNIEKEFTLVADIIARKQFKYRTGSKNYTDSIALTIIKFYLTIFKYCENAVREAYGFKLNQNTGTNYTNKEAKCAFDSIFFAKVTELIPILINKISPPDETTEIELNLLITNRWKKKFDELIINFQSNSNVFFEDIIQLGKLNKKNPFIKNIFFEASKFIAKYDKVASLKLYIHYLYQNLKSATFKNKPLPKTIQENLFKTNEQLHNFEQIVSELIKDRKNLKKALDSVPTIYVVKRKKIQLDRITIKEVQQQHSGTVELLNEYLRDEFEDDHNSIQSQEISSDKIKVEVIQEKDKSSHSIFLSELSLNPTLISVLELFSKNNFSIPQCELEEFAKSKGLFKNQLIEKINENCYDFLDDVLIEEKDNYFTIIPEYFQKISTK